MKKILLLNMPFTRPVQRDYGCPHGIKAAYCWPAIDLLLFGAAVRQHSYLYYIDAVAKKRSGHSLLDEIQQLRPDAIFTVLSSITLESDLSFIAKIRNILPKVEIWASGDLVFFSELRLKEVDYYVRDLTNKAEILKHLALSAGGGVIQENASSTFSVGVCPHELTLNYSYAMPYSLFTGITCVITNFGCPFRCDFCNSNKFPFKKRNPEEIIEELKYIQSLGIKEIVFRDFTFNASDAGSLCEEMIDNDIDLKWSCWTRVDMVDGDILKKMKSAGCYLISYGVESGSEEVLSQTGKSIALSRVKETFAVTREAGIEVLASFILGFPGEDPQKTVSLLFDLDPDYMSLNLLAPRIGSAFSVASGLSGKIENTDSLFSISDGLERTRDQVERRFYLRPGKLLGYLFLSLKSQRRILIFLRSAYGLAKRWFLISFV